MRMLLSSKQLERVVFFLSINKVKWIAAEGQSFRCFER